MSLSQTSVLKVYTTVIDDVIAGVRDAFLDEGVDEQVLQEMKQVWTSKLLACKAIESTPESQDQQAGGNAKSNGTKKSKAASAAASAAASSNNQQENGKANIITKTEPGQKNANITLPAQPNVANSQPRVLTIQVPASALQENQLQQVLTSPIISSIMPLPPHIASTVLQQHVNAYLQNLNITLTFHICSSLQLDGAVDTSDEEGSDISDDNIVDDDDEDLDKEEEDDLEAEGGAEEEPLNSEDDVTDEDASDLFDTDNVVVCQYDKITRSRNKWKFYLKDGIMHIGGKDYVFQKSNGDAEWNCQLSNGV
uniref:Transcription initiation factor IIA subunit 1 n=1 Tax=Anopheles melas TaxID=34690 RepID=A0A182TY72_9DIPT